MRSDDQDKRAQDLSETPFDAEFETEDELDDEDLENVAGGWSGEGDGDDGG